MDEQLSQIPTVTRWSVEFTHGLVLTGEGWRSGWGWLCHEHSPSLGMHGFSSQAEASLAFIAHSFECGHSG